MEIVHYHAAGGIVFDGDRVLLLRKPALGEIVLPKGHIEDGETPERAALRETMEETGYRNLRVVADLGTQQAQYVRDGKQYVRDETYFLMALADHQRSESGDHDDAEHDRATFKRLWIPVDEAAAMMTFEPARSFVKRAVEIYHEDTKARRS
ncbi:MAG: NUDIX domain-containing protein [Chloroflexi bacterium]|nr:NUDIX domain-containing protein [Chloroflexota bacterium]MBI3764567.1 NUDIX domain-containing protein [Chloroflexota bacterium]